MDYDISNENILALSLAYGFLHQVFYNEPTKGFIDGLVGERMFKDWLMPEKEAWEEAGLACFDAFTLGWQEGTILEEDLIADYIRLFGPADSILALPYESAYKRSGQGFQSPVKDAYRRVGVLPPTDNGEPDDHIGLEFAFLAHLCMQGMSGGENDEGIAAAREAQREFLTQHVLWWAPVFLEKVVENAETDYFRGAAWLSMGCLRQNALWLGLADPAFPLPEA